MSQNISQPWNGCVFNSLIGIKLHIIWCEIKKFSASLCIIKEASWATLWWILTVFDLASLKTAKIQPFGDHAASYIDKEGEIWYIPEECKRLWKII